jgi:hypothetical protein
MEMRSNNSGFPSIDVGFSQWMGGNVVSVLALAEIRVIFG